MQRFLTKDSGLQLRIKNASLISDVRENKEMKSNISRHMKYFEEDRIRQIKN